MYALTISKEKNLNKKIMAKNKHTTKKVSKGHYIYRGFSVVCVGYYHPEHRVCWEAIDEYGCGFAHGYSLKEVKCLIDSELDVLYNI